MKCWYLPDNEEAVSLLKSLDATLVFDSDRTVPPDNAERQVVEVVRYSRDRLKLIFGYHPDLVVLLKGMERHFFDAATKAWTFPHTETNLEQLNRFCEQHGWKLDYQDTWTERVLKPRLKGTNDGGAGCPVSFIHKLQELRYSENTVKIYGSVLAEFVGFLGETALDSATGADIERFLHYITTERNVSSSYHNAAIGAIRIYYEKVLGRPEIVMKVERPRREKLLPEVLSEEEVVALFRSIGNIKHKCILMTVYSAGLRLSEVVALKPEDIDSNRMLIFVKGAKGKKDRYTVLSPALLKWLREYYQESKPNKWLFEGILGGQYSMRSVQDIMRDAVKRAGIRKHATVHTLRHSFATHMLEGGTDLRYIQSLLGHSSSKTTEIYTHITTRGLEKVKSPFDRLHLDPDE